MGRKNTHTQEAESALERWGLWAKTSLPGDWPRQTILAKLIEYGAFGALAQSGGLGSIERIELCERVERWVVRQEERRRTVIVYQFAVNEPDEAVSRRIRSPVTTVRRLRSAILNDLQQYLDGMKAVYAER